MKIDKKQNEELNSFYVSKLMNDVGYLIGPMPVIYMKLNRIIDYNSETIKWLV